MALTCKGIFVIGSKRTPFCKYGGLLRELPASHAFAVAAKDAIYSANINSSLVDSTIIGNVNFLSQCDGGKTPRYCGIYSGVPIEKPALGVNKTCGSGLQAVITGSLEIVTGMAKVCLTGGTEIMSSLPFLVRNVKFGSTLGSPYQFEDHIKTQFVDSYSGLTLHKIAEMTAEKYKITKQMANEFAFNSRLKWKTASTKILQDELTSITVQFRKKEIEVTQDELVDANGEWTNYINAPTVLPDAEVVTSFNSSAPADGAAALVLADEETTKLNNAKPLARVVGYACVGIDSTNAGLGAVVAVKKLLVVTKTNVENIDLFEIDETFATQAIATIRELRVDENKVNVSGGALALGHPVGASGARMAAHLVHQLNRGNARRAIAASSCGGGQGVAVMFECV